MFADLSLENRTLKNVIEKSLKTSDKAWAYQLSDDTIFYELTLGMQDIIAEQDGIFLRGMRLALREVTECSPRYGFKKLFQGLRRQGNALNHKHVHRIYCLLKLNFRSKGK